MGRNPPYSQVVPDSEDEDDITNDFSFTVSKSKSEVSSIQPFSVMNRTDIQISSFSEDKTLSQPPIAVLAEASENNLTVNSSGKSSANAVPVSLLRGPSIVAKDVAASSTKPRPRPRPRTVNQDPANINVSIPAGVSSIGNVIPPTHDPVSSGQPDSVAQSSPIPGLGHLQDPDPEEPYTRGVAERAKLRSRTASSRVQGKQPELVEPEIIELSSDSEDELSFLSPTKSKRKGKETLPTRRSPRKKAKMTHPNTRMDRTTPISPVAVSGTHSPGSSRLPPSDPSAPSFFPSLPRSSPRRARAAGQPDVLSSPMPPPPRRRKRTSSSGAAGSRADKDFEHELTPPPPPFFAGSSPSTPAPPSLPEPHLSSLSPVPEPKKKNAKANGRKRKVAQSDDESDWNEDADKPSKNPSNFKPKPRARKRRAVQDEEEEPGANEPCDTTSKQKPKRQVNRRKKAEVVVSVTKPRSRKSTASVSPRKQPIEIPEVPPSVEDPTISGNDETRPDIESNKDDAEGKARQPTKRQRPTKSPRYTKNQQPASHEEPAPAQSKATDSASNRSKGKKRATSADDEGEGEDPPDVPSPADAGESDIVPVHGSNGASSSKDNAAKTSSNKAQKRQAHPVGMLHVESIASDRLYRMPRRDSRGVSEILRKMGSQPGSPFSSGPAHSPLTKMSRSAFRNVVPLHPNRRTPPPPPPRPPPPKKSKKQLELEEKWEMELEETVDGWYCLTEEERIQLRRAKRDAEMGYDD